MRKLSLRNTTKRPSFWGISSLGKRLSYALTPDSVTNIGKQLGDTAPRDDAFRQLSFTFAVIALSARIARIDGAITPEKYAAFRDAFPLRGGICLKIRQLFMLACEDPTPPEHYVTQIRYIFPKQVALHRALVERLFRIAAADGGISRDEEFAIGKIARTLEISAADYSQMLDSFQSGAKAHAVLGISKRSTASTIKSRYHELMRRYHPDRFAGETISPEVAMLLQLKTSEVHQAYRHLTGKAA